VSDVTTPRKPESQRFGRRRDFNWLARATSLVAAVVITFCLLVALAWLASTAIIIILGGVLFAVLLDAGARGLGRFVPWNRKARLLVLILIAVAAILLVLVLGGTVLVAQASSFLSAMRRLHEQANGLINASGFFDAGTDLVDLLPGRASLLGSATTFAGTSLNVVTFAAAVLFLGAFFAWDPSAYKAAILSILPKDRRSRVSDVLDLSARAMREWLVGQSISAAIVFVASFVVMIVGGMPYAGLLAAQAGLLCFIPTLGPFIAGVVIVLAGLSQSVTLALYGLGTYALIQFLETHLITPLVQERTVRLPPAITLALEIVAFVLFGTVGVVFIVPIAAAGKVLIEELYVKDYLGGPWENPEQKERSPMQRWLDGLLGIPTGH
jgi:predicted PurR-regulated permease PerM